MIHSTSNSRWLIVLLALLPAMVVHARQVRVEAVLSSERAFVGEPLTLQIVIENAQDVLPPALDAPPGLTIDYAGASSQPAPVWIVNGQRMDTGPDKYILQYRVTADRPGDYTIPPQTVRIAGQSYTTRPVSISVEQPPEDRSAILELTLSKPQAYVGEPVTLTIAWLFASDVQGVRFSNIADRAAFDLLPASDPRPPSARQGDARFVELDVDNQPTVFRLDRTVRNGREYNRLTGQRTIIPNRPGSLEIGPVVAMAQVRTGQRNVGILLTEPVLEPRASRSQPVTLEVIPLPAFGRPSNFTGLVGEFSIQAAAGPTSVNVGDPIDLSITIQGPEPLERVDAPDLASRPAFASAFRIDADGLRPSDSHPAGARRFSTTLRAVSADVNEIPPIELPYFDTRTGRYDVARSDPIPLDVRPTRVVTAQDAVTAPTIGVDVPPGGRSPVTPPAAPIASSNNPGLLANGSGPGALRQEHASLTTLLVAPMWAVGVLVPPAAFVAAWTYRLARGRRVDDRRALAASTRRALARLRRAGREPSRLATTIRAYAAERLGVAPAAVTAFDLSARLAHTAEARDLARLLDQADAARLHGDPPPAPAEIARVLRNLARQPSTSVGVKP